MAKTKRYKFQKKSRDLKTVICKNCGYEQQVSLYWIKLAQQRGVVSPQVRCFACGSHDKWVKKPYGNTMTKKVGAQKHELWRKLIIAREREKFDKRGKIKSDYKKHLSEEELKKLEQVEE